MIRAYPLHPSVSPGEILTLCVSSATPQFRVEFLRQGATSRALGEARFSDGRPAPDGAPDRDWDWPRHDFRVPEDWPSGAYLARLHAEGATGECLFVVRAHARRRAVIVYKLALFTWHAYNETSPGASLYTGGRTLTLRRPGGGAGGTPWDADVPDAYDAGSPRQVFAHWDAPFIAWLERAGYVVDYCTDLDVHAEPALLAPYRLLLCVGHDEYWSAPLRAHVEHFVAAGGNVAFFSANTCWWRVHVDAAGRAFSCDRTSLDPAGESGPAVDMWHATRSEASLTGVSYRHGGGWWDGERPALGYTVLAASHWVFAGAGLADGDTFGAAARLVGYECDGCALECTPGAGLRARADEGTPAEFELLAFAWLGPGWQDLKADGPSAATLGLYTRGGTVFNAATVDWARVLASGAEPAVERITRNVLDRLGGASDR